MTETVSVSSIADVAAAVPFLLGFEPTESIVVCGLNGPRSRIGCTLRFDLVDDAAVIAATIADYVHSLGEAMMLLAFTERGHAVTPLLRDVAERVPLPVRDAILVTGGRCYSALCDDATCCPSEGVPVKVNEQLAAAHAMSGTRVVTSRDQIETELRRPEVDEVAGHLSTAAPLDPLLLLSGQDAPTLASTDVAGVVVALNDVEVRDRLLTAVAEGWVDCAMAQALLGSVLRRCGTHDSQVAATYGAITYVQGDGMRARLAFQRALSDDASNTLASMLNVALENQIHPSVIRGILSAAK